MRMRPAAGGDALPRVLLDRHPSAMHGGEVVDEVPSQAQCELLDLANRCLFREGKHGVLLRVGGQDIAVVARYVAGLEVARQRDADADVLDLVGRATSDHTDQVSLGLAVLVVAEDDRHAYWPLYVE